MARNFTTLLFFVGLGLAVVAGCRSRTDYDRQSHTPANPPPAYNAPATRQIQQQPIQGSSSSSGSRRTPAFQGSGSR